MSEFPVTESSDVAEEVGGGFFNSVVDIFVDPSKVFRRIEAGLAWWKGYILLAVIGTILAWLTFPMQRHIMELNERGLSEEQLARTLEGFDKFKYVGLITSPIAIVIIFLITAGVIHLVISILSSRANYKKALSLIVYSTFISTLGQIVKTAVILSKGVEDITSRADMNVHLSLAAFFPELEGFKVALLDSLGVFEIWYYVILTFGIAYLFKLKKSSAVVPVIIIWLISFFLLMLGSRFGGTA